MVTCTKVHNPWSKIWMINRMRNSSNTWSNVITHMSDKIHFASGIIMVSIGTWCMKQIHKFIILPLSEPIYIITSASFGITTTLPFFVRFKGILISHNRVFTKMWRETMFSFESINSVSISSIVCTDLLVSKHKWIATATTSSLWLTFISWIDENLGFISDVHLELAFMLHYHGENLVEIRK